MKKSLVPLLIVSLLVGCNTMRDNLRSYENDLRGGSYHSTAVTTLKLAEKKNVDELLWRLMAGNSSALAGDYQMSIDQFDLAEDIFIKNDNRSVFSSTGQNTRAMLVNDKSFPYAGFGQDRIFCCLYKALNYAALGKRGAARTEFNRAYDHQENWLAERQKEIIANEKAVEKDAKAMEKEKNLEKGNHNGYVQTVASSDDFSNEMLQNTGYDPRNPVNLRQIPEINYINAYVYHLSGVFRWLNGDRAEQYFKDACRINQQNPVLREDLEAISRGGRPVDTVWLYVEDGMSPIREEFRIDLPIGLIPYVGRYVQYVGVAFPKLVYQENGCQNYSVVADGASSEFSLLEHLDHLIHTEYRIYMSGAVKREIMRCVLKASAQAAMGIAAQNVDNGYAKAGLIIGQLAVAGYSVATTSADLRCWSGLPKRVLVQRIHRPSSGKAIVQGDGTRVEISLPEGNSIVWIRKTSPSAAYVVKTISFK